ncbi:hypothetical protein L7F22_036850 [Adiantum nelumboides]|nr:hypothetical protein [Adiantum nelumboides]
MASGEGQSNPSTSGDAGRDHREDFGNEYGPPLPTQEELREMEHRRLVDEAMNLMLNFAKDPKLAKYMSETAFQDVQAQLKATTTSPPKPESKKQYSEKELEEEIDARLARILGAQKQGKKLDRKRKKSTNFPGYLGSQSTFDKAKKHKKHAAVPSSSSSESSSESSEEGRRSKKRTFGDVPDDGEPGELPEAEENEEILVPEQELKDEMFAAFRQQRIFADQLFELHKLIEVQRLIAGTPNVPINEIYFGVGNMIMDCDTDGSPSGLIGIEGVNAEAVGKEVSVFKEVGKAPSIVTEKNCGESKCPSNTAHAENEVSARRCSSLGVVPWPTPEPAQTGICQNPPFAQSFTPGPAVCGPFVAALQEHEAATTGSPLFAFPLPQSLTIVQSSYGSAVASAHQQESVPNHNRSPGCKVANLSGQRTPNKKHCAREGLQ